MSKRMLKFSHRERQVIQHLIDGGTRRSFADKHSIKKATVTEYVRRAKEKAGAVNIAQLAVIYWRLNNEATHL